MRAGADIKRLRFTVGDLVVAATEAAFEIAGNEKTAYRLAGFIVNKMLSRRFRKAGPSAADLTGRWRFH
jgi:hypothetical protein